MGYARVWKVLTVVTVAMAVVRRNGNRWLDAKQAAELGDRDLGTAYQVWDLLLHDPEQARSIIDPADMKAAKAALLDLAARERLTESDEFLRGQIAHMQADGGVPSGQLSKAACVAAYWHNGARKRYPRKEQWAQMRGSQHRGVVKQRYTFNGTGEATVTHVIPLDPVKRGGKKQPATLRRRVLYKVRADDGACYQWIELERTNLAFRDLFKGQRILLHSAKIKDHCEHHGVRFTEFYPNDVDLRPLDPKAASQP